MEMHVNIGGSDWGEGGGALPSWPLFCPPWTYKTIY